MRGNFKKKHQLRNSFRSEAENNSDNKYITASIEFPRRISPIDYKVEIITKGHSVGTLSYSFVTPKTDLPVDLSLQNRIYIV